MSYQEQVSWVIRHNSKEVKRNNRRVEETYFIEIYGEVSTVVEETTHEED